MAGFTHQFDATALREYDIRGIVGKTLHGTDAFAIGRVFGSIVASNGGKTVAVGYDGRLSSPDLEPELISGLIESGIDVVRIGRGPTPMLYFAATTLGTDGGIMVTGSHNPPDYNGFKMMLGRKPFFGPQIQQILAAMAASGRRGLRPARVSERAVDVSTRLHQPAAGGLGRRRPPASRWCGTMATAPPATCCRTWSPRLPGTQHVVLNGADRRPHFPAHHPDPDGAEEPCRAAHCRGTAHPAPMSALPSMATRTASVLWTARATSWPAISC